MSSKNISIFSKADEFTSKLEEFGIIQKGHFEYKGKAEDGSRKHGDYYINYRVLTTDQEAGLVPYYIEAINEWFSGRDDLLVVGVAMASLILPKLIQVELHKGTGIEYAYTEKREGKLGLYAPQSDKARGKHLLIIEDVCNNGTSTKEMMEILEQNKENLGFTGYSFLYGVHRGHTYFDQPEGAFYTMGHIKALAYHKDDCPECHKGEVPLKEYKK